MDGVKWPKGLEQLLFGRVFNQQIQRTVWASGLRLLALGDFFDQALTGVAWPQNLEFLSLGNKFNQVCVSDVGCFLLSKQERVEGNVLIFGRGIEG